MRRTQHGPKLRQASSLVRASAYTLALLILAVASIQADEAATGDLLRLDRAIKIAFENDPQVRAAREEVSAKEARIGRAQVGRDPKVAYCNLIAATQGVETAKKAVRAERQVAEMRQGLIEAKNGRDLVHTRLANTIRTRRKDFEVVPTALDNSASVDCSKVRPAARTLLTNSATWHTMSECSLIYYQKGDRNAT